MKGTDAHTPSPLRGRGGEGANADSAPHLASPLKGGGISIEQTRHIAAALSGKVQAGDVLALSGEVGAGKTTFAQAFIGALLARPENITSPTFTLVQGYDTTRPWRVLHADLYRLKHADELAELGLEEAFETQVALIEWPEIAEDILPADTLHICFEHAENDRRTIAMHSASNRWQDIIKEWTA